MCPVSAGSDFPPLAATTYSLISFNFESVVVTTKLVASSLLGVTNFTPFALFIRLSRDAKITETAIHVQSLIWILSVGCITIAEFLENPGVMMLSTSVFILA